MLKKILSLILAVCTVAAFAKPAAKKPAPPKAARKVVPGSGGRKAMDPKNFRAEDIFQVNRRILRAGQPNLITLTPRFRHLKWDFLQKMGTLHLEVSHANTADMRTGRPSRSSRDFDSVKFTIEGETLSFELPPAKEGSIYCTLLLKESSGKLKTVELAKFEFYALEDDLFKLRPYKGDFHVHTTYSHCGKPHEDPCYVAAVARSIGMDFLAITDHHNYDGGVHAMELSRKIPTDFRIYPGEECHRPNGISDMFRHGAPYPWTHVVSFGAKKGICYEANKNYDEFKRDIESRLKIYPAGWHEEMKRVAATFDYFFDKIHENGGIALFCHPFWFVTNRYNLPEEVRNYVMQKQRFDALELTGNDLNDAMWYEAQMTSGKRIPVVSVTDSHSARLALGKKYTVVFASDSDFVSLAKSIKEGNCVSVYLLKPGDAMRCHGSLRLVSYTYFLQRNFYPMHDEWCQTEGNLLVACLRGEVKPEEVSGLCKGRTDKMFRLFFGE